MRVEGLELVVQCLEFGDESLRFKLYGSGGRCFGCRVEGAMVRIWGEELRVHGFGLEV